MKREFITADDAEIVFYKLSNIARCQRELDEAEDELLESYSWEQWTELYAVYKSKDFLQNAISRYQKDHKYCEYYIGQIMIFHYMSCIENNTFENS